MREEPAWASMSATLALSTCEGSSTSSPGSSPGPTVTPCSWSRPRTTRTSRMSGTLRSRLGPLPSRAATMAFGTRFFAPRTRISPSSGVPPWTSRTSSVMRLAFLERGGTDGRRVRWATRVTDGAHAVRKQMVMRPAVGPVNPVRPRVIRRLHMTRAGGRPAGPTMSRVPVRNRPSRPGMRDHVLMTEVSSLTGRLLVATPALADPNFDRAVVLLLDHDEEGTLGVVLNRPTPVGRRRRAGVAGRALAGAPRVVFQGGPVSLDSALGLAVVPGDARGADRDGRSAGAGCTARSAWSTWRRRRNCSPPSWAPCGSSPGTRAGARVSWRTSSSRAPGTWSSRSRVTSPSPIPERLWRSVLRRQRGELAMVATYPDDPSLN